MELTQAINQRRSIRQFKTDPIDHNLICQLIESAIQAPSACNMQAWKFIVIDDQNIKDKIVESGGSSDIKNAPLGIVVTYDNRSKNTEYFDYIQSASAAIQNLLLRATELGLGSCWICHLPPQSTMRKILSIPNGQAIIAYIIIGYPEKKSVPMPRKHQLAGIMNYNQYNKDWPTTVINTKVILLQKILINIFYRLPLTIKKKWLNNIIDKKFTKKFDN